MHQYMQNKSQSNSQQLFLRSYTREMQEIKPWKGDSQHAQFCCYQWHETPDRQTIVE